MTNYCVVIYKNKKLKKVLKRSKSYLPSYRAYQYYKKNNDVRFPVMFDSRNYRVIYELALLGTKGKEIIGLKSKSNFLIKKLVNFYYEEKFLLKDHDSYLKIWHIEDLLKNQDPKSVFYVNNNLIINLDNWVHVITCKNFNDCERLYRHLKHTLILDPESNIFFIDVVLDSYRKEVYDKIEDLTDIPRSYLFRTSTK